MSNITNGRVNSPRDFLKRGQRVKVKVMAVSPKIGLSMKDVDQNTGDDLS